MLGLPTKKCLRSTSQSLVCRIPAPTSRSKSKLRTRAAPSRCNSAVFRSGADFDGLFWATRIRTPRFKAAAFNSSKMRSPYKTTKVTTAINVMMWNGRDRPASLKDEGLHHHRSTTNRKRQYRSPIRPNESSPTSSETLTAGLSGWGTPNPLVCFLPVRSCAEPKAWLGKTLIKEAEWGSILALNPT